MKNVKALAGVWVVLLGLFYPHVSAAANATSFENNEIEVEFYGVFTDFDFFRQSPLVFLDYLKNKDGHTYYFPKVLKGWIKIEHIPYLVALLDSKDPCSPVALTISSNIRPKSTIGQEAAFLIQGFRDGKYPSMLNSDQASKEEILKWWQSFKKSQESMLQ